MTNATIIFVAGRSGGHVLPAITLAQRHKALHPHDEIYFFTTDTQLDATIAHNYSCINGYIPFRLDNLPRAALGYPKFIIHFIRAVFKAIKLLRTYKPVKVVSMGGYISVPICFAAYLLRIPIELYELNVIPGRANLLVAPRARSIFICFGASASYFKRSCTLIDYPVRFSSDQQTQSQLHALSSIGLEPARRTLCILGGSQGSLFINESVKAWIIRNPALHHSIQIIHQTGALDTHDWKTFYASYRIPALVFPFCASLETYYVAADLIICRAGAGTLFEIQFFNKRCITLPLATHTTSHQIENARAMAQQHPHLFTVIEPKHLAKDPEVLHTTLTHQIVALNNYDSSLFKARTIE